MTKYEVRFQWHEGSVFMLPEIVEAEDSAEAARIRLRENGKSAALNYPEAVLVTTPGGYARIYRPIFKLDVV
jgi:hypothetical protein